MSGWDDLEGVTPWISNEDAESLLSGTLGVDETHDLAPLNTVVNALRGPAESVELVGLDAAVAAFGAVVVASQPDPSTARTRPMIKKLLSGKALAAIGVVTLASAGAAAAAGVVPTPFSSKPQAAISHEQDADDDESNDEVVVVDTAHETTPTTDESDAAEPSEVQVISEAAAVADVDAAEDDAADSSDGQGPDVNGPAKFGLCTAYQARTKHDDTTTTTEVATVAAEPVSDDAEGDLPVPFQALSDAADAAGQSVAEFCADAVPGGSADAPGQSGDNPSATAPGKSDDNPSGTAPGKSGDNPSGTAPGKSGGAPGNSGGDHGHPKTTNP